MVGWNEVRWTEATGLVCRMWLLVQALNMGADLTGQKDWIQHEETLGNREGGSQQKLRDQWERRQGRLDQAVALVVGPRLHLAGWGEVIDSTLQMERSGRLTGIDPGEGGGKPGQVKLDSVQCEKGFDHTFIHISLGHRRVLLNVHIIYKFRMMPLLHLPNLWFCFSALKKSQIFPLQTLMLIGKAQGKGPVLLH